MKKIVTLNCMGDNLVEPFISDNLIRGDLHSVNVVTENYNSKAELPIEPNTESLFLLTDPFNYIVDVITRMELSVKEKVLYNYLPEISIKLDEWVSCVSWIHPSNFLLYNDFVMSESYRKGIAEKIGVTDKSFWEYTENLYNVNTLTKDTMTFFNLQSSNREENWFKEMFSDQFVSNVPSEKIVDKVNTLERFNFYRTDEWFINLFKNNKKAIQLYTSLFDTDLDVNNIKNLTKAVL